MGFKNKKKLDVDENKTEDNIYSGFINTNETKEENIVTEESSKEENVQTNDYNGSNEKKDEPYQFKEKEYNKGFLEANTKVTNASKTSRGLLFGFYLIIIALGVLAFLMLRANKYEFYLKEDTILIDSGSSYQVKLIPKDERYFDYLNYNYDIADESIATVDEFGTVTAVGKGETTLKISLSPGFTSKTVKIITDEIAVYNVELGVYDGDKVEQKKDINMGVKHSITVKPIANSREDLNVSGTFRSSDENIAIVDDYGNVTAINPGTVTIYSKINDVEGEIKIDVSEDSSSVVEPTETTVPTVKPTVTTSTTTPKATTKATSTPTPKATTKATSTPTPQATTKTTSTPKATTKATTTPKATTTTTKPTSVSLGIASQTTKTVGDTLQLSAEVKPTTIKNYTVKWSTNDSKVATVSSGGLVKFVGKGTVTITAEVNGVKGTASIAVKEKVTAPSGTAFKMDQVKLSTTTLTIDKGKTKTFDITFTKAVGTIKVTSSDTKVLTVTLPKGDEDMPICNQGVCFMDGFTGSDKITVTVKGVATGTGYVNVELSDVETTSGSTLTGTGKVGILVK